MPCWLSTRPVSPRSVAVSPAAALAPSISRHWRSKGRRRPEQANNASHSQEFGRGERARRTGRMGGQSAIAGEAVRHDPQGHAVESGEGHSWRRGINRIGGRAWRERRPWRQPCRSQRIGCPADATHDADASLQDALGPRMLSPETRRWVPMSGRGETLRL